MRKKTCKIFKSFFMRWKLHSYYIILSMAKKLKVGRPKGSEKEPMNIFINKDRAKNLRQLAKDQQRTISIVVENALEKTYQI